MAHQPVQIPLKAQDNPFKWLLHFMRCSVAVRPCKSNCGTAFFHNWIFPLYMSGYISKAIRIMWKYGFA